jgi:hypothetical protein
MLRNWRFILQASMFSVERVCAAVTFMSGNRLKSWSRYPLHSQCFFAVFLSQYRETFWDKVSFRPSPIAYRTIKYLFIHQQIIPRYKINLRIALLIILQIVIISVFKEPEGSLTCSRNLAVAYRSYLVCSGPQPYILFPFSSNVSLLS